LDVASLGWSVAAFLATTGAFLAGAASSSLDESELAFGAGFLTVSKIRSVSYVSLGWTIVSEGVLSHSIVIQLHAAV